MWTPNTFYTFPMFMLFSQSRFKSLIAVLKEGCIEI